MCLYIYLYLLTHTFIYHCIHWFEGIWKLTRQSFFFFSFNIYWALTWHILCKFFYIFQLIFFSALFYLFVYLVFYFIFNFTILYWFWQNQLILLKWIYFNWRIITLQYCGVLTIYQHESVTGARVLCVPMDTCAPVEVCSWVEVCGSGKWKKKKDTKSKIFCHQHWGRKFWNVRLKFDSCFPKDICIPIWTVTRTDSDLETFRAMRKRN